MTSPIGEPQGLYRLAGTIPALCPHCGESLATTPPDESAGPEQFFHAKDIGLILSPPLVLDPVLLQQPAKTQILPPEPEKRRPTQPNDLFDHPAIGGKVTICVLCYGDHIDLHKRCLNSIRAWCSPERIDLRIAANQVGEASAKFLETVGATKIYWDTGDRLKYPAMRELFYDPDLPLATRWVVWFDDDSMARHQQWLPLLCEAIIYAEKGDVKVGMFGQKMRHPLKKLDGVTPQDWFKAGSWYTGRPWSNKRATPSPNGDQIEFIVGGFWAISTEAIYKCNIPDPRLIHWGGDIANGAQLWQNHLALKEINRTGELVRVSASEPRGASLPGNSPEKRLKLPWYM